MKTAIVEIVKNMGLIMVSSFLLMILYNNFIAWELNLPQFDFWAFLLLWVVHLLWRMPTAKIVTETKKN